ncbi:hypothetical protein HRH25_15095 [Flavisolibacter sp. BT320]|nr:hypothetical protein [Flavisolibacter longurius]
MNNLTMQENLMQKLLLYITENNPDLLFRLEEEEAVSNYLLDKVTSVSSIINGADQPDYLKEETCMSIMTQSLRPSKFNYICRVLEEEFEATHWQLKRSGTLKYEAVNLVMYCQPLFEAVHFSEANEENRLLYYAVAGAVVEYFDKDVSEREVLSNGVQQPTEA